MTNLSSIDYWRLADELSVINAAILITGNDPSSHYYDQEDRRVQQTSYDGFDAAFSALRNAVLGNKIRANIAMWARDSVEIVDQHMFQGEAMTFRREVHADGQEVAIPFDTLIRASNYATTIFSNREIVLLGLAKATTLYVLKEPSWERTTIDVEDLKNWLSAKGIYPDFFFPKGVVDDIGNDEHPRYSAKLACAVAAWKAVEKPKQNMSIKATVRAWVQSNAVIFGVADKDGIPPETAIEEISKVVNWETKGGANPTYVSAHSDAEPFDTEINNIPMIQDGLDSDIPF